MKTGKKICIYVGPSGNQYIAVEGAHVNLLVHYSRLAMEQLSTNGGTRLYIANGEKELVTWIYKFMLSGEKEPIDKSLNTFDVPELCNLYAHCMAMGVPSLQEKLDPHIKQLISTQRLELAALPYIAAAAPSLCVPMAAILAKKIIDSVGAVGLTDFSCIDMIYQIKDMDTVIDDAVKKELEHRANKSKRWYGRPELKNSVEWMQRYYSRRHSDSSPKIKSVLRADATAVQNTTKPTNIKDLKNGIMKLVKTSLPKTRTCFNCGQVGHIAKNCAAPRNGHDIPNDIVEAVTDVKTDSKNTTTPPVRDTRTCYNCQGVGHISRYCPARRGGNHIHSEIKTPAISDATATHDNPFNGTKNRQRRRKTVRSRNPPLIEVTGNGKLNGITTCDQEVRRGQV